MCATHFKWKTLIDELQSSAPTLLQSLEDATTVAVPPSKMRKKSRYPNKDAIIGVLACILLRFRNQSVNLLQRLMSMLMYSGHATKRVSTYTYV